MNENEVIKALECCGVNRNCAGCPKEKEPYGCYFVLCGGALDLINRQKAVIERLTAMVEAAEDYLNPLPFKNAYDEAIETAKSEARKELAERLKTRHHTFKTADNICIKCIPLDYIDSTLAEMESERE